MFYVNESLLCSYGAIIYTKGYQIINEIINFLLSFTLLSPCDTKVASVKLIYQHGHC